MNNTMGRGISYITVKQFDYIQIDDLHDTKIVGVIKK